MPQRLLIYLALIALSAAATAQAVGNARPARSIYWGAYAAGGQYGLVDAPWNMTSADRFEANAGKRMSLLEWGQAWRECSNTCGMRGFRADLMNKARVRGYLPVLSWGSYSAAAGPQQKAYRLAEIIDGRYDSFIRAWATEAKRWGHPFFLRFDWEMNTNSVPYSEDSNGNRPGEFVRMWRHVHDLFQQVGATNVTWVWCPNVEYSTSVKPLASLYPGRRLRRLDLPRRLQLGDQSPPSRRLALLRRGLPLDVRPRHEADRADQASDDRRDSLHRDRRFEGSMDHQRAHKAGAVRLPPDPSARLVQQVLGWDGLADRVVPRRASVSASGDSLACLFRKPVRSR